jgi:hypothetical protein
MAATMMRHDARNAQSKSNRIKMECFEKKKERHRQNSSNQRSEKRTRKEKQTHFMSKQQTKAR